MASRIELSSLQATLSRLVLPDAPLIDEVRFTSGPAQIATDPFALAMASPASATVKVSEASLAAFLEAKKPAGLTGFRVQISGGLIKVEAKAKVIFEIPVKADCTLEIVAGTELHVRLVSVEVAGGPARALVESAISKQNPILKTTDLPFPLKMTRVVLESGFVSIDGEALPPA